MTSSGLLVPGAELYCLATGATWGEGPVWLTAERALRFSDIPGNRVLQWYQDTGVLAVQAHEVEFTNGRTLDLDGSVLQCSHGRRRIERVRGDEVTSVVDRWGDHRLNSPNDVVVKSDGSIWFTDPSYGIKRDSEGRPGDMEYGDHYVFRADSVTGEVCPVVIDIEMPNGLAFSPDESLLYVADSSIDPPAGKRPLHPPGGHSIHVYDILDGRLAKNGREFAAIEPGIPDGMRVDTDGNVWSSSHDSIQVFAPDGTRIERIAVPEKVANLCFGGDDGTSLFITATTGLYRIETTAHDAAAAFR
ncbi:MAG: SMP-30/gluconolactonase/LRE family protein [Rhodococcus sp. (in: high G+C Gram-positive bacteria)]